MSTTRHAIFDLARLGKHQKKLKNVPSVFAIQDQLTTDDEAAEPASATVRDEATQKQVTFDDEPEEKTIEELDDEAYAVRRRLSQKTTVSDNS